MRYLLAARVRPDRKAELRRALERGKFGEGFPYGDLGAVLCAGRVDDSGTIRWVEVCYCREFYGVAMHEELPYLEQFLTDIQIADARSPRHCEGYPACNDCLCTRKVRFEGEPLLDYLQRSTPTFGRAAEHEARPTRWLGWRGEVTAEEDRLNHAPDRPANSGSLSTP